MGTPFCVCSATYFNNETNKVCVSCHHSCQTCTSTSQTACLTCPALSQRTLIAGACGCNQYYFENNVPTCATCVYTCATCTNTANCTSCNSAINHRYLSTSSMECLCEVGYYNVNSQRTCSPCLPSCTSCTIAT